MAFTIPPGGILLGLGCDLIEVARIREAIERDGSTFLPRVFTAEERAYCDGKAHPHQHFAALWAAKEAVSKCFTSGIGIGAELDWTSVAIGHGTRGEPLVHLDARGRALMEQVGATSVLVSLSHTAGGAMAVAALVKSPPEAPAP